MVRRGVKHALGRECWSGDAPPVFPLLRGQARVFAWPARPKLFLRALLDAIGRLLLCAPTDPYAQLARGVPCRGDRTRHPRPVSARRRNGRSMGWAKYCGGERACGATHRSIRRPPRSRPPGSRAPDRSPSCASSRRRAGGSLTPPPTSTRAPAPPPHPPRGLPAHPTHPSSSNPSRRPASRSQRALSCPPKHPARPAQPAQGRGDRHLLRCCLSNQ